MGARYFQNAKYSIKTKMYFIVTRTLENIPLSLLSFCYILYININIYCLKEKKYNNDMFRTKKKYTCLILINEVNIIMYACCKLTQVINFRICKLNQYY